MDSASLNQYEEQLYSVFKTFDVDNSEALSRAAVLALCDALQLEERGAALVDTLFERRAQRVTFAQFRSGLLAVLGAGGDGESAARPERAPPEPGPPQPADPAATPSDDESGREVAPKFVFGSKKYGRRSRPPRASSAPASPAPTSPAPASPERASPPTGRRARCKRSASAVEGRAPSPDFDHDSRVDCERALALCRRLRIDNIDRRLVERIFEAAPAAETTVGEFFDRLNASLTSSIAAASGPAGVAAAGDALPGELVADAWEGAGVLEPRRLLADLGFDGAALHAPDLELALDDELRALPEATDPRAPPLLLGALALSRLRRRRAQHYAEAAAAERDRLRADVAESDRRARLLAQEVDESHARLEAELVASLRRAEGRHAEAARSLEAQAAADAERAAAERAALRAEVARHAGAEARLRADAAALRERHEELGALAAAAEERALAAERECARLQAELRGATRAVPEPKVGAGDELAARLEELRRDNKLLRDRCDELCAELEAAHRAGVARAGGDGDAGPAGASWREEACAAEPDHVSDPFDRSEECESSLASVAPPPAADSEPLAADSEPLTADCEPLAASPPLAECGVQTEPEPATAAATFIATHNDTEQREYDEKQKLNDLVKELETSLEAMRQEYERCEEYWAGKLAEERALQAAEQRAGDRRLAELAQRIHEYERQFAPAPPAPAGAARAPALPAIAESELEAQVAELQREHADYRRDAERRLAAQRGRADRLAGNVRALRAAAVAAAAHKEQQARQSSGSAARSLPEGGAAWGEAGALRARLARADAAVARLTARLAAADMLVKELYVENCLLPRARYL